MHSRERLILILCLLLAAATSTALVNNHRLRRHQGQLEAELAQLRPLAAAVAKAQASRAQLSGSKPPSRGAASKAVRPPANPRDTDAERQAVEAENQALREQVMAQNLAIATAAQTNQIAEGDRNARSRRGRWRENELEMLRQTDPQRAQEIETQRAEFRERMRTDTQDKQNFLASVDVSHWPADLQENHARLVALYARMTEAIVQPPGEGGPDRDAQRELFSQWRETGERLQAEQDMLLADTARQLGFEGANVDQFVDYIKTIHQVTSPRGMFPGRGMGPPGPREGGGSRTSPTNP